jgi:hypothetical protein
MDSMLEITELEDLPPSPLPHNILDIPGGLY